MNTENVVKICACSGARPDHRRHKDAASTVGLGLRAFAALIATFGLLMLELAAYFALAQVWSAMSAAALLGAINFVIAAILFAIAADAAGVNSNWQTRSTVPRSMRCSSRRGPCSRRSPA